MSRQIKVLRVERIKQPKGYFLTELSYTGDDGKVKGMKIYPFDDQKGVADAFADAKEGDVYEVNFRKNDRDFWEFVPTPTKVGGKAEVATSTPAKKEQWVPDAERQRLIVRQNAVTNAVAYSASKEPKGVTITPAEVIEVAKQFEAYVFGETKTGDIE